MSKREFNPKSFFRKLHPEICDRLMGQMNLMTYLRDQEDTQDRAYFAWARSSPEVRKTADKDLRRINDLACDRARHYLHRAAERLWHDKPKLLDEAQEMSNYDLAATIFIESPHEFNNAYNEFYIDDYSFKIKRQGKESKRPKATKANKARLKEGLEEFLRQSGQGKRECVVEDYENEEKFAIIVYYQQRQKPEDSIQSGHLVTVWREPVEAAMAVYYKEQNILMVKGKAKFRNALIRLIGEIYFADPEFFEENFYREFDFSPLNEQGLELSYRRHDGIGGVRIAEVTVEPLSGNVGKLVVQCPNGHEAALAELGIPLQFARFSGVKIEVLPDGKRYKRKRTINLALPDRWNLNDTPRDKMLARYLEEWGFIARKKEDETARAVESAQELEEAFRARIAVRYARATAKVAHR